MLTHGGLIRELKTVLEAVNIDLGSCHGELLFLGDGLQRRTAKTGPLPKAAKHALRAAPSSGHQPHVETTSGENTQPAREAEANHIFHVLLDLERVSGRLQLLSVLQRQTKKQQDTGGSRTAFSKSKSRAAHEVNCSRAPDHLAAQHRHNKPADSQTDKRPNRSPLELCAKRREPVRVRASLSLTVLENARQDGRPNSAALKLHMLIKCFVSS